MKNLDEITEKDLRKWRENYIRTFGTAAWVNLNKRADQLKALEMKARKDNPALYR
jgi:hypothetical protein